MSTAVAREPRISDGCSTHDGLASSNTRCQNKLSKLLSASPAYHRKHKLKTHNSAVAERAPWSWGSDRGISGSGASTVSPEGEYDASPSAESKALGLKHSMKFSRQIKLPQSSLRFWRTKSSTQNMQHRIRACFLEAQNAHRSVLAILDDRREIPHNGKHLSQPMADHS